MNSHIRKIKRDKIFKLQLGLNWTIFFSYYWSWAQSSIHRLPGKNIRLHLTHTFTFSVLESGLNMGRALLLLQVPLLVRQDDANDSLTAQSLPATAKTWQGLHNIFTGPQESLVLAPAPSLGLSASPSSEHWVYPFAAPSSSPCLPPGWCWRRSCSPKSSSHSKDSTELAQDLHWAARITCFGSSSRTFISDFV